MGLCKCEKRKVTMLFCFEHQVNVCEHCLLAEHSRCIVKTYVQWLQDADYSPVCVLCNNSLSDESCGECVRLMCYDVVHWNCLNEYGENFPTNTAPAGYNCPVPQCKFVVFPAANAGSPVADALRKRLTTASWARRAIGIDSGVDHLEDQSNFTQKRPSINGIDRSAFANSENIHKHQQHDHDDSAMRERPNLTVQIDEVANEAVDQRTNESVMSESRTNLLLANSRSEITPNYSNVGLKQNDDEKKRLRRSCYSEAKRVLFIRLGFCGFRPERCTMKASRCLPRRSYLIVIVVMSVLTALFLLLNAVHDRSKDESYLIPAANPNIHVLPD